VAARPLLRCRPARGRRQGHRPPSRSLTFGLTWSALDSYLADLRELCVEYRKAAVALAPPQGDHSLMRKFNRYRLVLPYTADVEELEKGTTLTWQALLLKSQQSKWGPSIHTTDRSEESAGHTFSRHIAEIPAGAAVAFGGVDVQGNRAYWTLDAVNQDGTSWDVAWGYEMARADHQPWNEGELGALLDRIDQLLRRVAGELPIEAIALDTGDFTQELLRWQQARPEGSPWRPVKGTDKAQKKADGDIDGVVYRGEGVYLVHADHTRDLVQATYRRPAGSVGAANLPNGLGSSSSDRTYLQHLVGELAIIDPKSRKRRIKRAGRWDWLDAKRYAYAMRRLWLERLTNPPPAPRRYRLVNGYE
jgi:phage terminase large subunit GpA-like protein